MIEAEHRKWAQLLYYPYINRLMHRNFSNFYLINEFPRIDNNAGLLITPNHHSWWDGFFIHYVERIFLKRKAYVMMEEKQLKRYWFFRKVGAYSINQANAKSIIETANYTRKLIGNSQCTVIFYPQGEIEPFEKRPLALKKGLRLFISNVQSNFYILPAGFKIQYYDKKKPAVIARFGELIEGNIVKNDPSIFESEFTRNLDILSQAVFEKYNNVDLFQGLK